MALKTFTVAASVAIMAIALAAPVNAQNNANAPSAGAPSAAPAAPAARSSAPSPGPANAAPSRVNPSAGINNRSNFTASRPSGTRNFSNNRSNFTATRPSGTRNFSRNDRGDWNRRHHHRRHSNGFAFVPFGYYGPDYYDDYAYEAGPDCTLQRRVFRTRSGRRHVRWVQVCD